MICGRDKFAGEKIFEYFQDNDDLELRHICSAKRSLSIFRILMICRQDIFAGEKVFESFQDNEDLRLRQFCKQKSL